MRVFDRQYQQPKTFLAGTRRARTPADTLADFGRFMPEIGITRLANVTGLDRIGIPVVQAVRPNSRSLSVSQGKGADLDSAKVSAMMESAELWHAERIETPLRWASFDGLAGEPVVDIFGLPRTEGAVVRPETQRAWIQGWDLLQEEAVWVPHEMCNMNTVGLIPGRLTFSCNSNGLASGNHLLEAIEHALCEVIERDTHALSRARGLEGEASTRVTLAGVQDPALRDLLDRCDEAEMDVCVYELDSDIGVPTFSVGIVDRADRSTWRRLEIQWGWGSHLSPVIALSRALTEAAQARLTVIAGSRDDNPPPAYATLADLETSSRKREQAFAVTPTRTFSATGPLAETDTFEGDLEVMLTALRGVGVDRVVVVDLTQQRLGIPVVKVVVPGLEGPSTTPNYTPGARATRAREERS